VRGWGKPEPIRARMRGNPRRADIRPACPRPVPGATWPPPEVHPVPTTTTAVLFAALVIVPAAPAARGLGRDALGPGGMAAVPGSGTPVELLLHRLHVGGAIPAAMTYAGRNFDIVTGITGLLLGTWMLRG